jgi:hypothetical protein
VQEWVFDRDGARTGRDREDTAERPAPGAPVPAVPAPRRRRLGRRGRWAVAAGASLAVLTGGVAVAAASQDTSAVAAASDDQALPPAPQAPQALPRTETLPDAGAPEEGTAEDDSGTTPSAPWSALHEERQLQQRDGTVLTVVLHGGTVTELTADSMTVESSDGFTGTYAITSDTRIATPSGTVADLATGDVVLVEATVEDDTATAVTIRTASSAGVEATPDAADTGPGDSGDEA